MKSATHITESSYLNHVSYIFTASDLHLLYSTNVLFKYADDTYVISG